MEIKKNTKFKNDLIQFGIEFKKKNKDKALWKNVPHKTQQFTGKMFDDKNKNLFFYLMEHKRHFDVAIVPTMCIQFDKIESQHTLPVFYTKLQF